MRQRVLIANRGEIAVRVIHALKELDMESVAVYAKEDKDSLHIRLADRAVCIGEGPLSNSYLNIERIISAALITKCTAVHPGYGFLSENADFAKACRDNGLVFIGPSEEIIRLMGDKISARETAQKYGVPVIPAALASSDPLSEARKLGFPLMIKAAAGGGGKGLRICEDEGSFEQEYALAKKEALSAFGNDTVYMEKVLQDVRHTEVQVLADMYGSVLCVGQRNCSLQIDHQKVIEETAVLDPVLRDKLNKWSEAICKGIGYTGAGTCEFLVSGNDAYFLEMNTRIQVEHGITELVSGIDLVREQILAAFNEPLSFGTVSERGHAVECRVNAKSAGRIKTLHLPSGNGIRTDSALYQGCEVPARFDSMIAKIMAYAPDRKTAVSKMKRALDETVIGGLETNLNLLYGAIHENAFVNDTYTTETLEQIRGKYEN